MLSARRTRVLDALIDEYVKSNLPVSSSVIARSYLPGISAATIRSELFGLEHDGLAFSPHTSAGRIPTNSGYRIFVNFLLLKPAPVNSVALPLSTAEGSLSSPMSEPKPKGSLLTAFSAATAADIRDAVDALSAITTLLAVYCDTSALPVLVVRGLSRLAGQPEFGQPENLLPVLTLIENTERLYLLLHESIGDNDLAVRIGLDESVGLAHCSLLVRRLSRENNSLLGILGPTRMDYRRVLTSLEAGVASIQALSSRP